jgi:hypothetical protein
VKDLVADITDRMIFGLVAAMFAVSVLQKFPDVAGLGFYSDLVNVWYNDRAAVSANAVVTRFVTYPAFWIADNPQVYVLVTGVVLFAAVMVSTFILMKLLGRLGLARWRALLFALSPSFLFFAYYNIDVVAVLFIVAALYFAMRQNWTISGASLGLAVATKLFPFIYIPFVWSSQRNWKERIRYVLVAFLTWLAVNLPFMVANLSDWLTMVNVQGQWGIEDSWMIFVMPRMSPLSHYLFYILLALGIAHVLRHRMSLERAWFAATLVFMLTSFKFAPQYFLYILPFTAMLGFTSLEPLLVADMLNALIIATWFTPWLNAGNPLEAYSPTQWISLARELILLAVLGYVVHPNLLKWLSEPIARVQHNPCNRTGFVVLLDNQKNRPI